MIGPLTLATRHSYQMEGVQALERDTPADDVVEGLKNSPEPELGGSVDGAGGAMETSQGQLWDEPVPIRPLPPEIVEHILDNITDPQDLINCSRAVPLLDRVLVPRKTSYLFDQVLPFLFGYLDLQELLTSRLVCRQWSATIKQFVESLPARAPYNDDLHSSQMANSLARRTTGGYNRQLHFTPWVTLVASQQQLNAFEESYYEVRRRLGNWNPLFGHALHLIVPIEEEMNLVPFLMFMATFGEHIWHLRIVFSREQAEADLQAFRLNSHTGFRICAQLNFLRHLRSLTFILPGSIQDTHNLNALMDTSWTQNLPHLEMLVVYHDPQTPIKFTLSMAPLFQQLSRLTLSHWETRYAATLLNLREVDLYSISSDSQMKKFRSLDAPNLQKLSICFDHKKLMPGNLNVMLRKFSSLKVLLLEWMVPSKVSFPALKSVQDYPKISSLHTLYMQYHPNLNYGFLQWFPNLKYLYLTELVPHAVALNRAPLPGRNTTRDEAITIHGPLSQLDMDNSNIWNLLPELKFVEYNRVHRGIQDRRLGTTQLLRNANMLVQPDVEIYPRGGPPGAAILRETGDAGLASWAWERK